MICQHCGRAIFWAFHSDRYLHTGSQGQQCRPGSSPAVAEPRVW